MLVDKETLDTELLYYVCVFVLVLKFQNVCK